jgi:HD-GYP domain-containing protein (c-di-GMP phosphodiesterase class II)
VLRQGYPGIPTKGYLRLLESARGDADSSRVTVESPEATTVGSDRPETQQAAARLDPVAEGLLEDSRTRTAERLAGRDRWTSALVGGGFLVAAVATAAFAETDRSPSAGVAGALVLAYALLSRVEFEIGGGSAVPTQLALVPMLFVLPAAWVPLAVAAGYLLASLVDLARGTLHGQRVLVLMSSSWYAIGPALLFVLAGEPRPDWRDWPLYLAALAAQFAFDLVSSLVRERLAFGVSARLISGFLTWVFLVDLLLAPIGLLAAFAAEEMGYAALLVLPLAALLAIFARERRVRIDHALELSHAYRGTALLVGDLVEADDAYTGSHSRNVVELSVQVADALGLDARERQHTEFAALLHDVGKINVPNEIINKPGPLDDGEWALMKRHTIEGEQILKRVGGVLGEVGHIVRSCHERVDGKGYPDGLAGEEIPIVARIVCCCDAFSAMTTDRSYRKARSPAEAVEELRECAGTHFDSGVVEALISAVS